MMKYVYLTENEAPENESLPSNAVDTVAQCAFLDAKAFKKLRKRIKAELKKQQENQNDNQKMVVIYSTPVAVIASGLRSQIEPERVTAQWIQQTEALIELFQDYPSSCLLANMNALKADIKALAKVVALSKKERTVFNTLSKQTAETDIYTLSAHYMINNNEDLKRQLLILDACTAFNEYNEDVCDIQHVLSQQTLKQSQLEGQLNQSQQTLAKQQTEIGTLKQNAEKVANQLAQENTATKAALSKHALEIESNQNTIKQLSQELSQEKTAASTQLQALQKEINNQVEQIKKVNTEKEALNKTLTTAQTDLANQTEENELIIEQLHLVQEAFEESILKSNALKSDNQTLENKIAGLKSDNQTLENKITALQKQIERSDSHQAWLVKELLASHQRNAKSWSYKSLMKKQVALIKASGLFDEKWYLETYPEAATSKMSPILHYLLYGTVEGKNPSPEFNTKNYLSIYFDVANNGMNPFIHYIKFGQAEGRKADPLQKRLPSPKAE